MRRLEPWVPDSRPRPWTFGIGMAALGVSVAVMLGVGVYAIVKLGAA